MNIYEIIILYNYNDIDLEFWLSKQDWSNWKILGSFLS